MLLRALLTVGLITTCSIACAYENEPDGFRGLQWGAELSALSKEMKLNESNKTGENFYTRKGDKLAIGAADLTGISYGFWNGKLSSVLLFSSGMGNKSALIGAFREKFGGGYKSNDYIDEYWWFGDVTVIRLKCAVVGNDCHALFFSKELSKLKDADAKKQAAAGAKDF